VDKRSIYGDESYQIGITKINPKRVRVVVIRVPTTLVGGKRRECGV
jgi:hypothetical protein